MRSREIIGNQNETSRHRQCVCKQENCGACPEAAFYIRSAKNETIEGNWRTATRIAGATIEPNTKVESIVKGNRIFASK
jgi:hypothetical protein